MYSAYPGLTPKNKPTAGPCWDPDGLSIVPVAGALGAAGDRAIGNGVFERMVWKASYLSPANHGWAG